MTYNIHPILVHFPIAFLVLYSFIKIIPFNKYFPNVAWKQIERVLLLAGVLGALVANATGEIAEELVRPDHDIAEMHEFFASITIWMYGLLLLGEVLSMFMSTIILKIKSTQFIKFLTFIQNVLTNKTISIILAMCGFFAITITGMLGGVMVYGLSADPLAPIVLKLLGLNL